MLKSLPNIITFGRLLAVPLAVYLILTGELRSAFLVFVAAGISDALDGILARVLNARSRLGGFLDPLADKALLVSVYISLANIGVLPLWLVIMVVFRDIMIVGGVLLLTALDEPPQMEPLYISKANTLAQIALVALELAINGFALESPVVFSFTLTDWTQALVASTTALSGAAYVARFAPIFSGQNGH
ncbi:cardiolipin synthase (CMP-forming) [uncultured Gammaproteobacteria bacterium]